VTARTAIVHDWFQGYHGSERVVDVMRGLFAPGSEPDIHTFYAARHLLPDDLNERIVRESRLARLPGLRQDGYRAGRWKYLFPYMPWFFERLDLDPYELVISSSHTFAVNVRPRQGAIHVCYCHTPSYYAWRPVHTERSRGAARFALGVLRGRLRAIDVRASRRPDLYVANSEAVGERIRRFYGRDSLVVHPPVDVDEFEPGDKEPGRFLWVGRLVPHKQPALVVEAFRTLPYRLTMVGPGPLEPHLRRDLPANVEILEWLPRKELANKLGAASGFVHVGEEDFGIAMVEALAAGTPVVGLARGGACEIVRPEVDGVLVEREDVGLVRRAIEEVAEREWDPRELVARSRTFSRERFLERFREALASAGAA
jgi:glycosyltransferase involved in cell wall biosynthesis